MGGDEFIIYIQNPSDESLLDFGERIRYEIEQSPLQLDGDDIPITLSVGTVNQHNNGELSMRQLLKYADQAMYVSKTSGRNQVSSHTSDEAITG